MTGVPNGEPRELSDVEAKRLADYVANRLGAEERQVFEREILASPALATALYEDLGTQAMLDESRADLPAAAAPASVSRRRSARWWRPRAVLPIAAMLALALLTPRLLRTMRGGESRDESGEFRFRSPATTPGDTRPRAIAPIGEIASLPPRFVWTRAAGATAYRFELYSDDDRFVYSRLTTDTTLVIDQKFFPWDDVAGATWSVVPLAGNQERTPSDPIQIQVKRR